MIQKKRDGLILTMGQVCSVAYLISHFVGVDQASEEVTEMMLEESNTASKVKKVNLVLLMVFYRHQCWLVM